MSSGGPNSQRFSPFTPPIRGAFPLDREHRCAALVQGYLDCIKGALRSAPAGSSAAPSSNELCREWAARYLKCRMDAKLMSEEDLAGLGFASVELDNKDAPE